MNNSRNDRLAADYREMLSIQNRPYLSWIVTKGELPYAEEYLLDVKLRTYVLSASSGRYIVSTVNRCAVSVTLRGSYPHVAPYIRMLNIPPVFHPCWYSKGTYCSPVPWHEDISLKDYLLQMLGTLCYEPSLTDVSVPANYKALEWYAANRDNSAWFPSDPAELSQNRPQELAALQPTALQPEEIVDSWSVGR